VRKLMLFTLLLAWATLTGNAFAQLKGNATGLQIPRFVSLKSSRVNLRVGPGRKFSVQWLYLNSGLPVEVIQEYDQWRQIRDSEGTEGWVFHSLLSGKRTAIIAPWDKELSAKSSNEDSFARAYQNNSSNASVVGILQPGLVVSIESCDKSWCKVKKGKFIGYLPKPKIWGVYPKEVFEN